MKCYSELIRIPTFEERVRYLQTNSTVSETTFGGHRPLNQYLYRCPEWRDIRLKVCIRDNGCDLAHPDHPIFGERMIIHHIEPITIEDILDRSPRVFDLENLITTRHVTHLAIHYSNVDLLPSSIVERRPNDTCPWK